MDDGPSWRLLLAGLCCWHGAAPCELQHQLQVLEADAGDLPLLGGVPVRVQVRGRMGDEGRAGEDECGEDAGEDECGEDAGAGEDVGVQVTVAYGMRCSVGVLRRRWFGESTLDPFFGMAHPNTGADKRRREKRWLRTRRYTEDHMPAAGNAAVFAKAATGRPASAHANALSSMPTAVALPRHAQL
eukprot:1149985-Pelagomonas_calceolata.AAC.3